MNAKQQVFQFDARARTAIARSFAVAVPDSETADYVARAETVISDMIATIAGLERAKGEGKQMRRCLGRLRVAADDMISLFERSSELNKNSPLVLAALDLKDRISPETLRRYNPAFEAQTPANRPVQNAQLIVLTNLRAAYLTATSGGYTRCRTVVRTTLNEYSRQRNGLMSMPTMTLTDHAWRRMLGYKSGAIRLR